MLYISIIILVYCSIGGTGLFGKAFLAYLLINHKDFRKLIKTIDY